MFNAYLNYIFVLITMKLLNSQVIFLDSCLVENLLKEACGGSVLSTMLREDAHSRGKVSVALQSALDARVFETNSLLCWRSV